MIKMSQTAINECVAELRSASRRPIDPSALETLIGWLRPQFEKILDRLDGPTRWTKHGDRLRENSRHMGALADFFSSHTGANVVGINELTLATEMARADCALKAQRGAVAFEYCRVPPGLDSATGFDSSAAEALLRRLAPASEHLRRAG